MGFPANTARIDGHAANGQVYPSSQGHKESHWPEVFEGLRCCPKGFWFQLVRKQNLGCNLLSKEMLLSLAESVAVVGCKSFMYGQEEDSGQQQCKSFGYLFSDDPL